MIPDPVAEALRLAGLAGQTVRPTGRGLSARSWLVGDPPVAFVKARPGQPQRIRPELCALRQLERAGFHHAPRLLAASDCGSAIVLEAIDGVPLDPSEDPTMLESLGRIVAALHTLKVSESSGMKRSTDPLNLVDRVVHTARRDAARAEGELDEALAWLIDHRPDDVRERFFVHRDLRTANVLVGMRRIALVDFERACAADPAWDWVKLRWWCLDEYTAPGAAERFRRGYEERAAVPAPSNIRWFTMAEAIGLAARFGGNYRREALLQIQHLQADAPLPSWRGGSVNFD